MMKRVAWIAVVAALAFPQAASASSSVSAKQADRYVVSTVIPEIIQGLGGLTKSKPRKCHTVGPDAVCSVKSNVAGSGVYCVTVVDVYAGRSGLAWRELDAFCSTESIQ